MISADEQTPHSLFVVNGLARAVSEVHAVPSYKYLGGIITADGHPRAEVMYRKSLAAGIARPLSGPFFANSSFPIATRRTLLHALSVSRFVYGSVALRLACSQHRRIWYQGYMYLWRMLLKPKPGTAHRPHALAVLHAAQAPSPPLSLALMRATFLRRVARHGPSAVMTVLQRHWELQPAASWLGQLTLDMHLVGQYADAARVLLCASCPVRALFEAVAEDADWWVRIVRRATKLCVADVNGWATRLTVVQPAVLEPIATTRPDDEDPTQLPFQCDICGRRFALQKNLCSHELLKHQRWSPVRHFAFGEHCIVCLRWWHNVRRVQTHLRLNNGCLAKAVFLAPPLAHADILELESTDKLQRTAVKKGNWRRYEAVQPPLQCHGPLQLTRQERLDYYGEDLALADLHRGFLPEAEHVRWIQSYLAARSVEGARPYSAELWHQRSHLATAVGLHVSPA